MGPEVRGESQGQEEEETVKSIDDMLRELLANVDPGKVDLYLIWQLFSRQAYRIELLETMLEDHLSRRP
jgi:hypothetical protein